MKMSSPNDTRGAKADLPSVPKIRKKTARIYQKPKWQISKQKQTLPVLCVSAAKRRKKKKKSNGGPTETLSFPTIRAPTSTLRESWAFSFCFVKIHEDEELEWKQSQMLPRRLSVIFGGLGSDTNTVTNELLPTLKVQTDKEVYRPGDPIIITIEISNPSSNDGTAYSLLIERLGFEIKGIEKLDSQWFATQKPTSGSKQRRGSQKQKEEHIE